MGTPGFIGVGIVGEDNSEDLEVALEAVIVVERGGGRRQ